MSAIRNPIALAACLSMACVAAGFSAGAADKLTRNVMQLTSPAFNEGEPIPAKFTCDGRDVSPPLKWSGAPAGARSLVLIVDDPDAPVGTWVHWVLLDLPAGAGELPEDTPKEPVPARRRKTRAE
jgi:phosphatidylethanolamine-binding protein (PEBP) family uncharacterized protein